MTAPAIRRQSATARESAGCARPASARQIEVESTRDLARLATVAYVLSHELARLEGEGELAQHAIVFPTGEGGTLGADLAPRSVEFSFGGVTATVADQYARKLAQNIDDELAD